MIFYILLYHIIFKKNSKSEIQLDDFGGKYSSWYDFPLNLLNDIYYLVGG